MKNYIIRTAKKDTQHSKPHFFILNKGLNSGKPSKEPYANSLVLTFQNEQDCENYYWIAYSLWQSKFWHRNLVGSVIPFLRIFEFTHEFAKKADEAMADFEQHQKDVQALRLLELKENQFHQNINLINDMRRVILHRYTK